MEEAPLLANDEVKILLTYIKKNVINSITTEINSDFASFDQLSILDIPQIS